MKTWLVTRHSGAVFWARDAGIQVSDRGIVASLDPALLNAGDQVIGTLPINIAAEVIRRGATYCHLALELPAEARGKELSPEEMRLYGAKLENYHIEILNSPQSRAVHDGTASSVMLVITSGQSLPNLLPLLAMESPVAHLFLAVSSSPEAKVSAAKIQAVAVLLGLPVTLFDATPSAPLGAVQNFAQDCYAKIRVAAPDARIILNATGGTKMMSSAFASALGPAGEVIYCDTANDCIEYFIPQGRAALPLPPDLTSLEVYLLAQGQEIVECASSGDGWMETAQERSELTRYLATLLAGVDPKKIEDYIGELNRIAYEALPHATGNNKKTSWTPVQAQKWRNYKVDQLIEKLGLWCKVDDKTIEFRDEAAAAYLKGGWLEEYAALTMIDLGVARSHWGVGVKIAPIGAAIPVSKDKNGSLNELDLAIVWRNRLLVIECKTGQQLGKESQEILNKIEAIRSYAAGSFGTGWLLSARHVAKDAVTLQRAKEYRIDIFEREATAAIGQRIARWMKLPMDVNSLKFLEENEMKCKRRDAAHVAALQPAV